MKYDYLILYSTIPDEELAQKISLALLNQRLAACTNIIKGMTSYYWWENKIESACELILIIKTTEKLRLECQKLILALHPYTVPCILEIPIQGGNPEFLNWLSVETKKT